VQPVQHFTWFARLACLARFALHSKAEYILKFIAIPNISKTPKYLLVTLCVPVGGDAFFYFILK
jgi:hypothetical protein